MNPDFWNAKWRNNETGFHLKETNPFLRRHWASLKSTVDDAVFIPLCGKSNDIVWLAQHSKQVVGVELSKKAVDEFLADNGITPTIRHTEHFIEFRHENITLLCGDFFRLSPDDIAGCQFIYDRASLIALPTDMRQAYIDKLHTLMPEEKRRLLVTLEYPPT